MVGGCIVDAGDKVVVWLHRQGGRIINVCSGETVVVVIVADGDGKEWWWWWWWWWWSTCGVVGKMERIRMRNEGLKEILK